jgi:hypothetical protein
MAALATRSFERIRVHANFLWTRRGATRATERADRIDGILGADCLVNTRGQTDTLLVTDIGLRTNPVLGGTDILFVDGGLRQRIGVQTIFFLGAGSELKGDRDRAHFTMRVGLTHIY